jgi:ParB/RepB/Spo0J family partition protein
MASSNRSMSRDIPLHLIDPDPDQPRKHFDTAAVSELAQSMAANGLAVPILLRPVGERYLIVHGERRWRAAQSLGWAAIAADVRDIDADTAQWLALVENVQRADLTPMEEATAYQRRLAAGMTQHALGARLGKSQSYVAQKLRLLTLPEPLQLLLARRLLTEGHGRQLLRLRDWYHDIPFDVAHEAPGLADAGDWATDDLIVLLATTLGARPMGPVGGIVPEDESIRASLAAAARMLLASFDTDPTPRPLWELAAFWWGCLAAGYHVSVADLQHGLNVWHEHWLTTVLWRIGLLPVQEKTRPEDPDRQREWWGFHEDARHMRMPAADALPEAVIAEAAEYIIGPDGTGRDSYVLPYRIQLEGAEAA